MCKCVHLRMDKGVDCIWGVSSDFLFQTFCFFIRIFQYNGRNKNIILRGAMLKGQVPDTRKPCRSSDKKTKRAGDQGCLDKDGGSLEDPAATPEPTLLELGGLKIDCCGKIVGNCSIE